MKLSGSILSSPSMGIPFYAGCGLGLKKCNAEKPGPVHDKFVVVCEELKQMLQSTSLFELAPGLKEGLTFLKR